MGWIHVAEDSDSRSAVVNAVMDFRGGGCGSIKLRLMFWLTEDLSAS